VGGLRSFGRGAWGSGFGVWERGLSGGVLSRFGRGVW